MDRRFFTIYKVTNLINGKFYVGKHITDDLDDGYMGSGLLIKRAIKKYGLDNFVKEYLEIFDSEHQMNLAEKILVVLDEQSYNLCPGGKGGWGYLNDGSEKHRQRVSRAAAKSNTSEKGRKGIAAARAKHGKIGNPHDWTGRKHRPETIEKMKASHSLKSRPPKRGPYKKKTGV